MKITYENVNTNKLHDELIAAGIVPLLVESLDSTTWISFTDDTDMVAVQVVVDAHDPTPVAIIQEPSPDERLDVLEPTVDDIVTVLEAIV